jgi:hypothetical protein
VRKLTLADTWNILEYEKRRADFRRHIIALKRARRVDVGDHMSLVFENRDTTLFQIQEMIRIERMVDEKQIAAEVEFYNELIPGEGELSATLFIEYPEPAQARVALRQLTGLSRHVALRIGDAVIPADFEPGRERPDGVSSVQYLRFCLPLRERDALRAGSAPISIVVDHPAYTATARLSADTRAALAEDFAA